jgi:hypothetical protein
MRGWLESAQKAISEVCDNQCKAFIFACYKDDSDKAQTHMKSQRARRRLTLSFYCHKAIETCRTTIRDTAGRSPTASA